MFCHHHSAGFWCVTAVFRVLMRLVVPLPANNDEPDVPVWGQNRKILEWLNRFTQAGFAFDVLGKPGDRESAPTTVPLGTTHDDWQTIASICGLGEDNFVAAGGLLPLTTAEVEHFRRNHRGTESHVNRDFLTARCDLPSPLAELYGLYQHRVRVDAEAALFLAQATHSTRVASIMADLLAIGAFANGHEFITHMGLTYAVPAAFDTSDIIDRANLEAARRLTLPADNPSHLLTLSPDEIGALASHIAEKYTLSAGEFLEKANLLAEARQDVNRLPTDQHFTTAYSEGDIPASAAWGMRIVTAYGNHLPLWAGTAPDAQASMQ